MTSSSSSSSPQYFFVDDNSTDIHYLGNWSLTTVTADNYTSVGLTAYPMYGTVHTYQSQGALANFTFTFSGSFVEVRFAPSASNDYIECTIDEDEYLISTSNGCSSTSLDNGVHTLTLGIRPSSHNSQILDYIRYLALPNATVTPGDRWISIGDETVRSTKLSDQTAILSPGGTLDYEFMGTSLSLYKASVFTDSHWPSYGYYTIDGGEPVNITLENNATPLISYIYPQILIQTPPLPYGKHHFHFALDLTPEADRMPLRGTIIVQNGSIQSEPIPQTVYQFDDQYSPPTSSTSSRGRLGGIIGGTLAAALITAVVVYLSILRHRRKLFLRRHFVNEEELVNPFFSGQGRSNDDTRLPMEKRSAGTLGTGLSGSSSNSAECRPEIRASRFIVHEDSGEDVIQPDQDVEIVDLPPTYEGIETRRRITSGPPPAQEVASAATVKNPIILSWQNSPSTR